MKKIISIILIAAAALLPLSLYGCVGGDNGRIKIYMGLWPQPSLKHDVAMYEKWKKNFEEDYPQYEIIPSPYVYAPDVFPADAIGGKIPTIFQTYFTEPQSLIEKGFIRDITDLVKELGWYDKMDPGMRESLSSGGKLYGIPRDGYGMGLFLNLKMLYEVGVIDKDENGYILYDSDGNPLYPTTFEQIYEISQLIVENYDGCYGIVILSADKTGGWQFCNMAWNFGYEPLQVPNGDGTYRANLNCEGAVRALEWIQRMNNEGLVYPGTALSYADWYQKIGSGKVAMAFTGSDAIAQPVTHYGFNKDDIAFVPMPTGNGVDYYSLYGGTPFCFSYKATDEQVRGALKFLEYIGRSPETSEISLQAMRTGYQTAIAKGMPILPTLRPWINEDFLEAVEDLDREFINVNMDYFRDFFDTFNERKKKEEPYYCQSMYKLLDFAIQEVLSKPSANVAALLETANNQFQANFLDKLK